MPHNGPIRIGGRSVYQFINDICDNQHHIYYDRHHDYYEYWLLIVDYARNNFESFLEDLLDDWLDHHLPELFNAGRYRIHFELDVDIPRDFEFQSISSTLYDRQQITAPSVNTFHVTVESRHFRTFSVELPAPFDDMFRYPIDIKQWIDEIGGQLLAHIRPVTHNRYPICWGAENERFAPDGIQWRESELRWTHETVASWNSGVDRRQQTEANKKALDLLLSHCDEQQVEDYTNHKWFIVVGQSGTRYRIRRASQINVDVLDDENNVKYKLCTVPDEHSRGIPIEDQLLAQKTLIELNEQLFLDTAIQHRHGDRYIPSREIQNGIWNALRMES